MLGPKSGVHGLKCIDREGTACTKAVLQSRVLFRDFAKLDGYVLAEVTWLLFDVWVVFCWFLGEGSRVAPCLPLSRGVSLVCAEVALGFPSLPASLVLVGALGGRRGCSWSCWCSSRFLASVAVSRTSSRWTCLFILVFNGFPHCRSCTAVFAAFSELRGVRQVERFAACSVDIRRK